MSEHAIETAIRIPFKRFDLTLQLENNLPVSTFIAATIRGGFGYTFRHLVCATKAPSCADCMLRKTCVYCFLFESQPPDNAPRLKKYHAIPRPFALRSIQENNTISLDLVLIGNATEYLPYFIYTLNALGKNGLGKSHAKFTVNQVFREKRIIYPIDGTNLAPDLPPDVLHINPDAPKTGTLRLVFKTPLVIRQQDTVLRSINSRTLVATTLRRITNLNSFYGANPTLEIDPKPYLDAASSLTINWDLTPERLSRYSTRQHTRLDYSGYIGNATITGNIGTLIPLFKAGEILGIGKNTVFGFGKFEVEEI